MKTNYISGGIAAATIGLLAVGAAAEDSKPANTLGLGGYWDTIAFSGNLEAGITGNVDGPGNKINFGHAFTDKSNIPVLNQLMGTIDRPLDPKAEGYDFGFRIQAFYGSDARYTHFLYEGDDITYARNQLDVVEANFVAHTPWLTDGGIDFKIGQYPTLLGSEVIPAAGNFFYSHSYIFNFGLPLKHTGGYATVHTLPWLDLYAGVDTGVNTSIFGGDNNHAAAFMGGVGLTFLDGNLTTLYATHIGAEQPESTSGTGISPDADKRQYHDIVVTWKITDAFTSITEGNYVRDSAVNAAARGIAQYLEYKVNDWLSLGVRGEYWSGGPAFIGEFPGNFDFVDVEKGKPSGTELGPVSTTHYVAFTFGANIKPLADVKYLEGFMLRPEIRYDHTTDGVRAYNTDQTGTGQSDRQLTLAVDFLLPF